MKNQTSVSSIKISDELHIQKIKNYFLVYNPFSDKGILILDKEAFSIINATKKYSSYEKIIRYTLKKSNSSEEQIKEKISELISLDILYENSPHPIRFSKPSRIDIWLHITNQCNLRCKYCFISHSPEVMEYEVAKKGIENSIISAKKNGFKKVTLKFAGGEPSLQRKLLFKVAKFAESFSKKQDIILEMVLITNGTLLSKDYIEELNEHMIHVNISLDGIQKDHDQTRVYVNGKGSYVQVEKGLMNLIKYSKDFHVSVVVNSINIKNLDKLVLFFLKNKLRFVLNFVKDNPLSESYLVPNNDDLIKGMKKVYKLIEKNMPEYSMMNTILDFIKFKPHFKTCGSGQSYIVITQKGTVSSCQMKQSETFTTVDDKDLIKKIHEKTHFPIISQENKEGCSTCNWKYICTSGCPLVTLKTYGRADVPSPYCRTYKALIPEVLRLEGLRLLRQENGSFTA